MNNTTNLHVQPDDRFSVDKYDDFVSVTCRGPHGTYTFIIRHESREALDSLIEAARAARALIPEPKEQP